MKILYKHKNGKERVANKFFVFPVKLENKWVWGKQLVHQVLYVLPMDKSETKILTGPIPANMKVEIQKLYWMDLRTFKNHRELQEWKLRKIQ